MTKFLKGERVDILTNHTRRGVVLGMFTDLYIVQLDKPLQLGKDSLSCMIVHPDNLARRKRNWNWKW